MQFPSIDLGVLRLSARILPRFFPRALSVLNASSLSAVTCLFALHKRFLFTWKHLCRRLLRVFANVPSPLCSLR